MVKLIYFITVLIGCASAQQCNTTMWLAAIYRSSFNETCIEERGYLTQKMVASVVGAKCVAQCVQDEHCVGAEWRPTEPTYCRHLYSDTQVRVASVIEPDDKSTVTYNPESVRIGKSSRLLSNTVKKLEPKRSGETRIARQLYAL